METQVFIFSYDHYLPAKSLYDQFCGLGYDTYILNCESPNDPQFEATDHIIKLPNVYYSGQWNEMMKRLHGDVVLVTNADVHIPNVPLLMRRLNRYYRRRDAGLYAPNVAWTPWVYNPYLLPDLGHGLRVIPATDSVIWSLNSTIAERIGTIDLNVNRLGWGIEIVAAYYCNQEGKTVVRDYGIKCVHPESTAYDRDKADHEFRSWIDTLRLGEPFWQYYHSRDHYGFGWHGDDSPLLQRSTLL